MTPREWCMSVSKKDGPRPVVDSLFAEEWLNKLPEEVWRKALRLAWKGYKLEAASLLEYHLGVGEVGKVPGTQAGL